MSKAERTSGTVAALAIAAWAAVLLIAFLSNRGSDIGQTFNLAAKGGGGPVFGLGFFDSLNGFCAATLIVVAWAGVGKTIRRSLPADADENGSRSFRFAIDASIGAAIWSLVWFLLGLVGAYSSPI